MPLLSHWVRVVVLALLGWGPAGSAPAASPPDRGPPLLVVVETGPGAGCDAESVRAAIAAELGARVVAPTASSESALAGAGPRTSALLVAIDHDRIVVTLRGHGDQEVTRSFAAPATRAAKLRVIAWLAGNVARDQLATLTLPEAPSEASGPSSEASDGSAADAPLADADPPPEARLDPPPAATAPPPLAARAAPAPASSGPSPAEAVEEVPRWTFSALGGAAVLFTSPYQQGFSRTPRAWSAVGQLEAHRHVDDWLVGAALDVGPLGVHPLGAALLVGTQGRLDRARFEASFGLGVEAFVDKRAVGDGTFSSQTRGAAYLRAGVAALYPVWGAWDAVVQLGGHVTALDASSTTFALGVLGLRLNLPSAPSSAPRVAAPEPVDLPRWTFTLSGGLAVTFDSPWTSQWSGTHPGGGSGGVAGAVEAHRHLGAWFVGLAGDLGPRPYHQVGGALLLGKQARVGPVRIEGSGGVGAEQHIERTYFDASLGVSYQDVTRARPYARVAFCASHPLAPQLDAVAQLVGHLTATDRPAGAFVFGAVGLRLTLP
jgi:hypothetical protein